jgi:hypothetical protein
VNSSKDDVDAFKAMWDDIPHVTKEVYAPDVDETIDISVDTQQYEIRISDEIAKSIKWQTVTSLNPNSNGKGTKPTSSSCHWFHCSSVIGPNQRY